MEVFAPEHLPGVGMGNLTSIAAICGLIGVALTSGALLAQGVLGTLIFTLSALIVLGQKPDLGGSPELVVGAIIILGVLLIARILLAKRATKAEAELVGAAKDSPETKQAYKRITRQRFQEQLLAIAAVSWGGLLVGFAWAEWNEMPFTLDDREAAAGMAIALIAAAIGGDIVWRFVTGAVRAGASPGIVAAAVVFIVYLVNVASVYVPFAGAVALLVALLLVVRLRRRKAEKHRGLRILS